MNVLVAQSVRHWTRRQPVGNVLFLTNVVFFFAPLFNKCRFFFRSLIFCPSLFQLGKGKAIVRVWYVDIAKSLYENAPVER